MSTQPPPSPASPAQERCDNPGCLHTVADGCPAMPAPSPSAGTPPAERDPYAFGRYALPPQAGTPPATVTPEAKSLSAAATGESPASGSTIHAGTPPVGEPALDYDELMRRYLEVLPYRGLFDTLKANSEREITRLRDALAQAQRERDEARHVVCETLWMAGRYADGRRSYAVGMYNDARRKAEAGGYAADAKPAVDGDSPEWPTLVERAEAAGATLAQARAEFWREAAQVAREWALGGDNPLDDVNVVLRQLADQMDQRATPAPAPPQE